MTDIHRRPALAEAFFRPRSVALIGASGDPKKITSRPQRYLKKAGYRGTIVPINPGRDEILGDRAYPSLAAVPFAVDHAFLMVGAADVPQAIEQCVAAGVQVATMFSAGFAELGAEGARRQRELVATARAGGLRLLGPNCLGMINVHDAVPLTANAVVEQEQLVPGFLSVVSQSGSMLGTLLTRAQARGLGFSKLVSVGNESDLAVGEIVDLLVDDPDTGAILLFLETFRDSERLATAARRAFAAGKPVIAFKLGRSAVGRQVASSHTGAMAGADDVANAFFRDHGILRVETMEGLIEAAQFVRGQRPPASRRIGVLTATGGVAAMIVDRLGLAGCEVVRPSAEVRRRLAAQGIEIPDVPLIDIPMGASEGGRYSAILSALLASDHCDAVVSVIGSSARTNPQVIVDRVLSASGRERKPLAVFLGPKADAGLALLQQHGVAAFNTPESCADVVTAYSLWRAPAARHSVAADRIDWPADVPADRGRTLNERDAAAVFAAAGVPMAAHAVLQPGMTQAGFAGPYAAKILSADIPHKTDAGLVALNVDEVGLGATVTRLTERARAQTPTARIGGVLVQAMVRGLAELIVGYRRDPEVGPVVLLALGGITAELERSRSVRIAPVSIETARGMLADIPKLAMLDGFRNLPLGDCEALAQAIVAVSRLALFEGPQIAEAEINPLIVLPRGQGVCAVDSLVVID